MSNRATLTAVKIDTVLGETLYGYILRDDYMVYVNDTHDSTILKFSEFELLQAVDNDIRDIVDDAIVELWAHVIDNGCSVNDVWFDKDEIESML